MYDLASGLPYHWILNGLPHRYPRLETDLRCEVLIVGSGITGALCAHACRQAGLHPTVVDAREIATGSTAASTALLQYELDTPMHVLAERVGPADAVRVYQLGKEAVHGLIELAQSLDEPSITPRKSLQYASKSSHAKALYHEHILRSTHGLRTDLLTRGDTRKLFPSIDADALLSHDGAVVDPYSFTHRLLQHVISRGGAVYDRTEVTGWERDEKGGHILRTRNAQRIHARYLVFTTGYESQKHLPKPLMKLHSTYAVASERMTDGPPWHEDWMIWETARPYIYMRTTPDQRVIVGGLDEPFRDPERRDALLHRKTKKLDAAFRDLMPFVPFQPAYAWCGTFGETEDGLPYFDRDLNTGAWFVLGMGGNGIVFSWIGARIICDAILGKPNVESRLFRFAR